MSWNDADVVKEIKPKQQAWSDSDIAVSPAPTSEPSMLSKFNPMNNPLVRGAYGLAEGGSNMLTGMGGMALGGLRGLASLASGEGHEKATQNIQGLANAVTYEPKTAEGAVTAKGLALPMEYASKLGGFMGRNSGIAELTGTQDAAESIGEAAPQIAATLLGGRSALKSARSAADASAAAKLSENIRKSEMDAPRIEAAQLANKYGIAINPAQSNPSMMNTLRAKVAGKDKIAKELHDANQYRPVEIIKDEIGIGRSDQITAESLNKIRAEAAKPKEAIKKIAEFTDDGTTLSAIDGLKQDTMIGGKGVARKLNTLITDAENFIAKNPNGTQIMAEIDLLRETARNIKKKDSPKKKELAEARTSLGIANALEAMIERNLEKSGNADLLSQYRDGRRLSAKTFVAEDVIDFNTGKVKVSDLAKMTSGDTALTGAMADLGKIYGNFPESMRLKEGGFGLADASELGQTHLLRTSVPGTLGAIAGLPFGSPILGAATGAALGEVVGSRYAKRMVSPEFQASKAIPTDFRPQQPRIVQINKDIPYTLPELNPQPATGPLPSVESMVIPGSWMEGLMQRGGRSNLPAMSEDLLPNNAGSALITPNAGSTRLPQLPPDISMPPLMPLPARPIAGKSAPIGIPDQLLPLSEQYPQGIPIGAAEGRMPVAETPLPKLPPQERGLLSLEDPATVRVSGKRTGLLDRGNEMNFPLKLEVANRPEIIKATHAFIDEAAGIKEAISLETNGFKKSQLEAKLRGVENRFMAGWKELGFKNEAQLRDLTQKLYQTGGETQRGIVKQRGLLDFNKE